MAVLLAALFTVSGSVFCYMSIVSECVHSLVDNKDNVTAITSVTAVRI